MYCLKHDLPVPFRYHDEPLDLEKGVLKRILDKGREAVFIVDASSDSSICSLPGGMYIWVWKFQLDMSTCLSTL